MENSDILTGFSNPNYTLSKDDALNSNQLPPSTQYYDTDSSNIYEDILDTKHSNGQNTNTNTTTKDTITSPAAINNGGSKNNGRSQSQSMDSLSGGDATYDSVATYESVTSPNDSEGHFSMTSSCVTSPGYEHLTHNDGLVTVEHEEDGHIYSEVADQDGGSVKTGSSGFTGFYATAHESRTPLLAEDEDEKKEEGDEETSEENQAKQPLLKDKERVQGLDGSRVACSPGADSSDSGIQSDVTHVHGPINDELYAVVEKKKPAQEDKKVKEEKEDVLPPGWEKHEDEDGPYYWHIKSGTIQRDPPPPPTPSKTESTSKPSLNIRKAKQASGRKDMESPSEDLLQEFEDHALKYASHSLKSIKSTKQREAAEEAAAITRGVGATDKDGRTTSAPIRFAVRSLGWVEIAEADLTPERSSKAVNKCIVDLSLGRNDINDVVGRWGDGKDLFMDLDESNLTLSDPTDMSVLNVQPIQSIRVWGVGRDNGRDFAYVARDRVSRRHMCHVFRCDTPARQIANTLRDICKKIMMEQSLQQGMQAMTSSLKGVNAASNGATAGASRPNHLPNLEKHGTGNGAQGGSNERITFQDLLANTSFPTPMEEPKKILKCHFLGTMEVTSPTGVGVLNTAMEKVYARVPPEQWMYVDVAVAPSTVTITEHGKPENVLSESRVRFLSFMGIAQKNVKLCSYISHTAQDTYIAHVFHCEPSAGAVCKTIEAACKLRYQKCLDAHQKQMQSAAQQQAQPQHGKLEPATSTSSLASTLTSLRSGVHNVFDIIKKKTSDMTTKKS